MKPLEKDLYREIFPNNDPVHVAAEQASVRIPDLFKGLLGLLGAFGTGLWRVYSNTKDVSLVDATRSARVEPLTLISKNCSTLEYLPDINQGVLDLFIGYYLQAVALLATIEDVKVVRFLDRLNPDRDLNDVMLFESYKNKFSLLEESYKFKLPMAQTDKELHTFDSQINFAIESAISKNANSDPDDEINGPYSEGRSTAATLRETADLSSGKLINVLIKQGDQEITVPVSFRLAAALTPFSVIENIFTYHKDDNTFIERYHAWRSGRISLIRDLILCQDLITESKKAMMEDNNNLFSEIIRRVNNSKKYALLSDNPSLATASNIFVIDEEEARQVGDALGGKFGSKLIMRKIFDNSYAMLIVVIDREWEMVSYYSRGIPAPTTVSVKDIKKRARKDNGVDILNILKSYNLGSTPSF